MRSFVCNEGSGPVLVHLPHNSVVLPEDFDYRRSAQERERDIHVLVDHHTDVLFAPLYGTSFVNSYCRVYFDPERYADPSKEVMNEIGMGVFYTHTVDGLRFRPDDEPGVYQSKLDKFYHPYHQNLTDCCIRLMEQYGRCFLIDGHSYPKRCFPFEQFPDDERPEIDIGTDSVHTPEWLKEELFAICTAAGYSVGFDQPFKGTLVPTSLIGDPRLVACMLEVRRDVYLDQTAYENGVVRIDTDKLKRFHIMLEKVYQKLISFKV